MPATSRLEISLIRSLPMENSVASRSMRRTGVSTSDVFTRAPRHYLLSTRVHKERAEMVVMIVFSCFLVFFQHLLFILRGSFDFERLILLEIARPRCEQSRVSRRSKFKFAISVIHKRYESLHHSGNDIIMKIAR